MPYVVRPSGIALTQVTCKCRQCALKPQQDDECDILCNTGTKVLLPEESNGLHDQNPQLEGHILVVDEGHKRPQLQHNSLGQHAATSSKAVTQSVSQCMLGSGIAAQCSSCIRISCNVWWSSMIWWVTVTHGVTSWAFKQEADLPAVQLQTREVPLQLGLREAHRAPCKHLAFRKSRKVGKKSSHLRQTEVL